MLPSLPSALRQLGHKHTALLGATGGQIVADTDAHTPGTGTSVFYALKALTDVVLDSVTLDDGWSGSLAGVTILAGDVLLVRCTSVTLTSGTAVLYQV